MHTRSLLAISLHRVHQRSSPKRLRHHGRRSEAFRGAVAILCPVHGNGSWEGLYRGARCCGGRGAAPKIILIRDHSALSRWGLPRNGVLGSSPAFRRSYRLPDKEDGYVSPKTPSRPVSVSAPC